MLAATLRLSASALWATAVLAATSKPPNFVFILTDDQDAHMGGVDHMPLLQKYLVNEGTYYKNHYCTVSVCCPSRVNLWTGRTAHNTNVTDLYPPYGGYPKWVEEGHNEDWLATWLQDLGYQTYYDGKFLNFHHVQNYDNPPVKGLNQSDFLLDPYAYQYFKGQMSRNGAKPVAYDGILSTDILAGKAIGFLEDAARYEQPFFLAIAPVAPHSNVDLSNGVEQTPPGYAERHAHLFKDYKIPRTYNFNPDVPSGVGWVSRLPKQNETVLEYHDEWQRARLRSLQAVDELVEGVVKKLEEQGKLDNTYIIYTTDNGYHIGQHRLPPGKTCPFETDINIPLIIRGPGIPAGHESQLVSSMTDLAPTILHLAGSDRPDLDGLILPLDAPAGSGMPTEHVNVEFWGLAFPEGKYVEQFPVPNNTYKTLRIISQDYNLAYTVWCSGEHEYYDHKLDPGEMNNYMGANAESLLPGYTISGRPFDQVVARLDALLMVTKSCKAQSCRTPWDTIFPSGGITTLEEALDSRFDTFFTNQPKVMFNECQHGYLIAGEGPQDVNIWGTKDATMSEEDARSQIWNFSRYPSYFQSRLGDWSAWT